MTLLGPTPAVRDRRDDHVGQRDSPSRAAAADARERLHLRVLPARRRRAVPGLRRASAVRRRWRPTSCFSCSLVFLITNAVNFLLIAVDVAVIDGQPIMRSLRHVYAPTLPVELAVGLLTAGVAFVYRQEDLGALGDARRSHADLPVPAADRPELAGAQGTTRGAHAGARVAAGRASEHRAPDAVAARQDDGAALCGRGPLLARDRKRARTQSSATRTSSTPPRCCTTSASSSSRTRSCSPIRS